MSAPLVTRVIVASVQIQLAVLLVIVLAPGTKETRAKLVNTVERHYFTFTLKYLREIKNIRLINLLKIYRLYKDFYRCRFF